MQARTEPGEAMIEALCLWLPRHGDSIQRPCGAGSRHVPSDDSDDELEAAAGMSTKSRPEPASSADAPTPAFKKPAATLDASKMMAMLASVSGAAPKAEESQPPAEAVHTPAMSSTAGGGGGGSDAPDPNKLAAEAIRAKLMGDTARHQKLMAQVRTRSQLDALRRLRMRVCGAAWCYCGSVHFRPRAHMTRVTFRWPPSRNALQALGAAVAAAMHRVQAMAATRWGTAAVGYW